MVAAQSSLIAIRGCVSLSRPGSAVASSWGAGSLLKESIDSWPRSLAVDTPRRAGTEGTRRHQVYVRATEPATGLPVRPRTRPAWSVPGRPSSIKLQ